MSIIVVYVNGRLVIRVRGNNVFHVDRVVLVDELDARVVQVLSLFPVVLVVRLWRRLERLQRDAVLAAHQRGFAVGGQPVADRDLAILAALVVLRVQNGHFHGLMAPRAPVGQRRDPQAVRGVHADERAGHAVRVLHVVVVVVHLQVGHVVAAVNARVRATRQRVVPVVTPRSLVEGGRRQCRLKAQQEQKTTPRVRFVFPT